MNDLVWMISKVMLTLGTKADRQTLGWTTHTHLTYNLPPSLSQELILRVHFDEKRGKLFGATGGQYCEPLTSKKRRIYLQKLLGAKFCLEGKLLRRAIDIPSSIIILGVPTTLYWRFLARSGLVKDLPPAFAFLLSTTCISTGRKHLLEPQLSSTNSPCLSSQCGDLLSSEQNNLAKEFLRHHTQFNSLQQTFFEYLLWARWVKVEANSCFGGNCSVSFPSSGFSINISTSET